MSDNYETRSNWVNRSASWKVLKHVSLSPFKVSFSSQVQNQTSWARLGLDVPTLGCHKMSVCHTLVWCQNGSTYYQSSFTNSVWCLTILTGSPGISCVVFIEPPCTLFKVVEVHDMTPMRKRKVVEYRYHLLQVKSDDDASGSSAVNLDSVSDSSPAFLHAGHLVQLDSFLSTRGPCGRLFGLYLIMCASLVTWHLFCREVHVLFKLWSLLFYFEYSLTVIIMKCI